MKFYYSVTFLQNIFTICGPLSEFSKPSSSSFTHISLSQPSQLTPVKQNATAVIISNTIWFETWASRIKLIKPVSLLFINCLATESTFFNNTMFQNRNFHVKVYFLPVQPQRNYFKSLYAFVSISMKPKFYKL